MMRKHTWRSPILIFFLLAVTILYACYRHETAVPVPATKYVNEENPSKTLIVMLPGRGGSMKNFEEARFISLANENGVDSDVVTVDLHEGYYYNRTMIQRLRIDVIQPALKNGYQKIWFVGVSLGGFGALMYTKEDSANIAGILAIAPYLGDQIIDKIKKAGGIGKWEPQSNRSSDDYEDDLWKWLKQGHAGVPVYLVYGTDDRMADGHKMLAELLPPDRTIAIPGGHNWKIWTELWKLFLDRKLMQ